MTSISGQYVSPSAEKSLPFCFRKKIRSILKGHKTVAKAGQAGKMRTPIFGQEEKKKGVEKISLKAKLDAREREKVSAFFAFDILFVIPLRSFCPLLEKKVIPSSCKIHRHN